MVHAEQAQHDDDRIETGPLPIAAAQVQPHAEFIERQRHAKAVKNSAHAALPVGHFHEKQDAPDRGEGKYPIVQVVDVRPAHVEKKVRYPAGHDENHQHPRSDEREQERGKRYPREMACESSFRGQVHLETVSGSAEKGQLKVRCIETKHRLKCDRVRGTDRLKP